MASTETKVNILSKVGSTFYIAGTRFRVDFPYDGCLVIYDETGSSLSLGETWVSPTGSILATGLAVCFS